MAGKRKATTLMDCPGALLGNPSYPETDDHGNVTVEVTFLISALAWLKRHKAVPLRADLSPWDDTGIVIWFRATQGPGTRV